MCVWEHTSGTSSCVCVHVCVSVWGGEHTSGSSASSNTSRDRTSNSRRPAMVRMVGMAVVMVAMAGMGVGVVGMMGMGVGMVDMGVGMRRRNPELNH